HTNNQQSTKPLFLKPVSQSMFREIWHTELQFQWYHKTFIWLSILGSSFLIIINHACHTTSCRFYLKRKCISVKYPYLLQQTHIPSRSIESSDQRLPICLNR